MPPPTRPKSAIEEPPSPYPVMASYIPSQSSPYTRRKARMSRKSTSSALPASRKPITAPERKAAMNAGATPLRASSAVRALA
jgi:hypothetical protein